MNLPFRRWWGGANRSNRRLALALAARGHEVHVVTPTLAATANERSGDWRAALVRDGIAVEAGPEGPRFVDQGVRVIVAEEPSRIERTLSAVLARVNPDRVLVSSEDASQRLLRAAVAFDATRVVYLAHTPQLLPFGEASLSPGPERARLVAGVGGIQCISHHVAGVVRAAIGRNARVAHPPHYDAPAVAPVGRHDGAVLLLHAATVKGLPVFLALAERLPNRRFRAVPGYATTAADLAAMAARPNVELIANARDLATIWPDTAVVLVPSLWDEGFGMVAVDALAQGLPVLVADHSGLVEASLGVAPRLPVARITRWEQTIEENGLPAPIVLAQPVDAWIDALGQLLASEAVWRDRAARSLEAAHAFVAQARIESCEEALATPPDSIATRAPALDPLAARLAALSPSQRATLHARLKALGPAPTPIPRLPPDLPAPLSASQRGFWWLESLRPGAANIACAVRITGPLDAARLARSVEALVERHDALRTIFRDRDGDPIAEVRPVTVTLACVDLSEAGIDAYLQEAVSRPFDLATGPLLRAELLRCGALRQVFLLTLHHIVADGWSLDLILRDLVDGYRAAGSAVSAARTAPRVRFADVAAWEETRLAGPLRAALAAQVERLRDVPPLELPTDRPRGPGSLDRAAVVAFAAPLSRLQSLRALAAEEETTLFVVLGALVHVLLGWHAGQEDFALGVPVANRGRPELEDVVGCFVNTVAVRPRGVARGSFRDAVRVFRDEVRQAFAAQEIPIERVVEGVNPERRADRNPLYDVLVSLRDERSAGLPEAAELRFEGLPLAPGAAKVDLAFSFWESASGLAGGVEYATALFDEATVAGLVARLEVLAHEVVAAPGRRLSRVEMLTAAELAWLAAVEVGPAEPPGDPSLSTFLDERLRREPDRVVVRAGDEAWTCSTLDRAAARVHEHLAHAGIRAGDAVGVSVRRRPGLLAAMLGIWRAGGVYVPLDPVLPEGRRRAMALDAAVRVTFVDDLPFGLPGPRPLPIDEATTAPAAVRSGATCGHALTHVLYTSGSTGRPKGVGLTHRGALALLRWAEGVFPREAGASLLASSAIGFDLSLFELLLPIVVGGAALLVSDVLSLAERIVAPTMLNTVPSAAGALLALHALPGSVRVVALAGEPLQAGLADRLYAAGVDRVFDLYGPTECTTYATSAERVPGGPATIGRPIAGGRAYLLDRDLRRVPVGVVGEVYLAGAGVARGYVGDPAATAAVFLPDVAIEGERMYCTGDLARRLPDGQLVFCGRRDEQVKVRGYRVEPGEIEAALASQPGVRGAAVLACGDTLTAWVEGDAEPAALRAALAEMLPPWMVPATLTRVSTLPRTASGKVDRRRLPGPAAPEQPRPCATPTEQLLGALWTDLLQRDVDADTEFFLAGGHSLLAARMVVLVRHRAGVEMPLRWVFDTPRLGALAVRIDGARAGALAVAPVPPDPARRGEPERVPLLPSQRALVVAEAWADGDPRWLLPIAVRVRWEIEIEALVAAVRALAARHGALRTVYGDDADGPWQREDPAAEVPVESLDLRGDPEAVERGSAFVRDTRPFDLRTGPLVRARVARLDHADFIVGLSLHHVVADAESVGILLRELRALYDAARAGVPHALAPAPSLLAVARAAALPSPARARAEAWWQAQQALVEPVDLPIDRPRPPVVSGSTGVVPFVVPAAVAEALSARGHAAGATPFMTWLAVFVAWLHRYTGQRTITVATPISARSRADVSAVVGFLGTMVGLPFTVERAWSFATLLREVRERSLVALEHAAAFPAVTSAPGSLRVSFGVDEGEEWPAGWEPLAGPPAPAKFELSVLMRLRPSGARGAFVFTTDVYDEATIRAMVGSAARFCSSLAHAGDAPLRTIACADLDPAVGPSAPPGPPILARVASHVARTPQAVALRKGARAWTYAELWRGASEVAETLRALGVGPGVEVAVLRGAGVDQAIALLATWCAGGTGVLLDPALPLKRRRMLVARCAVVVGSGAARRIPSQADRTPRAMDPGVVIYTSGTTATPKGVRLSAAALEHLADVADLALGIRPTDRVARFAAPGFDATLWELLQALCVGASLDVIPAAVRLDARRAVAWLRDRQINVLTAPPSWLAALSPAPLPRLHTLVVAGEECPPSLAAAWGEGRAFWNAYGPTEAGVCVSMHRCGTAAPTLGRPVANMRMEVLDAEGLPTARGAIGELWVDGPGLADGYIDDPERTAERFRPAPDGRRRYRTGDRVRLGADGELLFAGRVDRQRKLAGQRVDPGEVEAVLRTHPAVAAAAAEVVDGRLVAWVVAPEADVNDLQRWLSGFLEPIRLPRAIVAVASLPLTPNGKVDYRALPVPPAMPAVGPTNSVEAILLEACRACLGLGIGVDTDFFAAGGDSLAAMRVCAAAFDRGLSIRPLDLLQARTVRALAARALRGARPSAAAPAAPEPEVLPLTPLQEGILFESIHTGAAGTYLQQILFDVDEALDVDALAAAWQRAVDRHPGLRVSFRWEGEGARQQIHRDVEVPVTSMLLAGDVDDALRRYLAEDRARGVPLDRPPLQRVTALRAPDGRCWILWTHHHLLLDAWSYGLLADEIRRDYATRGQAPTSPVVPFTRFFAWLSTWPREEGRAAWARVLEGAPRTPPPIVHAPPRSTSICKLERAFFIPRAATREGLGITFATLCSAAWAWVLARHADSDDVVFGTVVSGRPPDLAGADRMIGMFSQTVAIRVRIAGATVRSWMADVQREVQAAAERAWVGLAELAGGSEQGRPGEPMFTTLLVVAAGGVPTGTRTGELRVVEIVERSTFPLTVTVVPTADGGLLALKWREGAANRLDVAMLGEQFAFAVDDLLRHADAPLDALDPRLGSRETVEESVEEDVDAGLLERIEAQVAANGDAVAVLGRHVVLRYAELWRRAGAVAGELARRGVQREAPVLVLLERDVDLPIAVLGALRAGAAALCLPVDAPRSEVDSLMSRLAVRVVIDADLVERAVADAPGLPVRMPRDAMAALVRTSGSTGAPRVVALTHGALANRIRWAQRAYPLGADDVVLHSAGTGFDFSWWELLAPLAAGARLATLPEVSGADPEALLGAVVRVGATVAHFVPSVLEAVLERPEAARLARLRLLLIGGEVLPPALVARLADLGAPAPINQYGPAEATIDVSWHPTRPGEDPVPIGRAIDHVRLHVLDRVLRPLPRGAVGVLFIGGAALARGYVGEPGATAERFVPDPLTCEAGARMYRTGDLAWRGHDGALRYVGRADDELKIRGVRVQPEEVEAALCDAPGVRVAGVIATGVGAARKLIAFVAPEAVDVGAIAATLRARLPAVLLPAAVIPVAALPLGATGKLDRVKLATMASRRRVPLAPSTPLSDDEEALEPIWLDVLGVAHAPRDMTFWSLGGHSLAAARLLARSAQVLGRSVTWAEFAAAPTLAGMAATLRAAAPPLSRGPEPARFRLLPVHDRVLSLEAAIGRCSAVLAWVSPPLRLDPAAVRLAVADVAARHVALRIRLVRADGEAWAEVATPDPPFLTDVTGAWNEPGLTRAIAVAAAGEFSAAHAPPWRVDILGGPDGQVRVLATLHHLLADGASAALLQAELWEAYEARRAGRVPFDPDVPSYADYLGWLHAWRRSPAAAQAMGVARAALTPTPPPPGLRDGGGPGPTSVHLGIDAARWHGFLRHSRANDTTPQLLLGVAAAGAIGDLAGASEVAITMVTGNRHIPETRRIVGLLANLIAMRVRIDDPVAATHARFVSLVAAGLLPFEDVLDALVTDEDPAKSAADATAWMERLPVVVALNQGLAEPGGAGSGWEAVEAAPAVSAFDVVVTGVSAESGARIRLDRHHARLSEARLNELAAALLRRIDHIARSGAEFPA